ncbi:WAS/WASL-interacting protein family member 2-like isoform X1 [Chironomus tepperi]|uniref:WAS/WASL-interacting protein family member 2-like isoform X1 n=1 Tax=Chironomus tepperi TaxID=113505 RepID=UPI00391F36A4
MSGPPPPPPPMMSGPPPPPMANFNNAKKLGGNSSGGDMRGALLSQIQKGTQLKKVSTVDKSKPKAGRVADPNASPISKGPSQGSPAVRSQGSAKTSPDSSTSSPIRQGGFSNLTDELQYKLTLKKNKNSPLKESKSIVETKESSPPSSTSSPKSFVDEIKSKQSVISPKHQSSTSTTTSPPHTVSDAIPNRSSLFNNSFNNNNVNNISSKDSSFESKSQSSAPKINHGKPNLAPKPPPQLSLAMNNNVNNSNNSLNDGSRKTVARHQSMKSPRSPPITLASTTGPFNTDNHFGTIRNPSNHHKTQEALNLQVTQKSVAQRPTIKPPPPPVPNRNIATNLSTQSHAKSTTALNNTHSDTNLSAPPTRRMPNSGSSSNISNMERNVDVIDSTAAPPLPPHRMSSAQKAQQRSQQQLQLQQQQVINSPIPPEVPRRHSSMRASLDNGANNRFPSPNPNQKPVTRLVVDLEARYSLLFHSVSEFPAPKQFLNVNKSYPSKAVGPANGM